VADDALSKELITDLIRSAWVVEMARARVYETWAGAEPRFSASARRTGARAALVARSLDTLGRTADAALVAPHVEWILGLAGADPATTPFSDLFLVRLGDWVDAHAAAFMTEGAGELKGLGVEERADVRVPEQIPQPAPFEPLSSPTVEPPGEVKFRFGILSDLHIGSSLGEEMARAAIGDLNRSGAELVIQLGDLTDHGNKSEFESAAKTLAGLDMPAATMMGNHDVYSYEEELLRGREYYPALFGRDPHGTLLEHKGIRFAVLDSAEDALSPFAPFNLLTGTFMEGAGGAVTRGSLSAPQHDILAEVAAPGSGPAFIFLHHPPQPFTSFPPIIFGLRDLDSGRLHATCDSGNVWGVFAGHTHRNARPRDFGTTPVQEVAIPRDYPYGYALVDVTANGYAYRWIQLSDRNLIHAALERATLIHRRYGTGPEAARAFSWTRN